MDEQINQTIKIINRGGLVIFPSDTVYGAIVDATNTQAVKKLIQFKARPPGKAISVFVRDFKMLNQLVEVNDRQNRTLKEILPGPFTVILKSKHKAVKLLESEKGNLGIRIPINRLIGKLIAKLGKSITATSANLSGYPPHYSIESLMKRLPLQKKQLIDFIVDVGKLPRNKPSTVIDLTEPLLKILRQGDIKLITTGKYLSQSPEQTKKISQFVLEKYISNLKTEPLIIFIKGDLGVGKTIFVKGIGEGLGVTNIISPSYVIYYEYPIKVQSFNRLVHVDLYNIEEKEEFKHLGLGKYFHEGNIICFEWGEKAGEIYNKLKKIGEVVFVEMKYVSEREREIIIRNNVK